MIGFWAAFEDARLSASGAQGEEGEEVGGAEEEQRRSISARASSRALAARMGASCGRKTGKSD